MHVTDIRALKGGPDFDLDVHGFTFHAPPPQPEGINSDDENVRAAAVEEDYGPKVVELVKPSKTLVKSRPFFRRVVKQLGK